MIHDPQAISRQYLAARYDNRPVSHRLKTEPKLFELRWNYAVAVLIMGAVWAGLMMVPGQ